MEEIKVGEFVRINNDWRTICIGIGKVIKVVQETIYVDMRNNLPISFQKNQIAKHSPNIIDLIEVGDYVNGKLITNVDKVDNRNIIEWDDGDMYSSEIENDKFIKLIVTKEQFKSIEYEV